MSDDACNCGEPHYHDMPTPVGLGADGSPIYSTYLGGWDVHATEGPLVMIAPGDVETERVACQLMLTPDSARELARSLLAYATVAEREAQRVA